MLASYGKFGFSRLDSDIYIYEIAKGKCLATSSEINCYSFCNEGRQFFLILKLSWC